MTADKHPLRMPPRIKTDFNRWVNARNHLKEHWEHPASVLCAHCDEPIELAWSSSAVGRKLIHGRCWPEWKRNNKKETL